tara:strand:- start:265 stop:648 length:384 start_codon:yes stop_codon:yes gene_type:complete
MADIEDLVIPPPNFDDEWKFWIWHNINRGIGRDKVYEILEEKGFPTSMIEEEIRWSPEKGKIKTTMDELKESWDEEEQKRKENEKDQNAQEKRRAKDKKKTDAKIEKEQSPLGIVDAEIVEEVSNAS